MKLKLTWLLTLFMAFVMQFSFAQEKTVTGTVTTAMDGLPLPGASVIVKGTSKGQQTDFDGKFTIQVNQGAVLVISYVGMKPAEVTIGAGNTYNVALEDASSLDEVVIVGFGIKETETQKAGSYTTVSATDISSTPVVSIDQALQGRVAGLQVGAISGQPGAFTPVFLRGVSSLTADSNPLYVINGVPVLSGDNAAQAASANPLASLNSSDIESVTVLKDAMSTSIYGARGANGVILITTKSGKADQSRFSLSTEYGYGDVAFEEFDWLNSEEHINLIALGRMNSGLNSNQADAVNFATAFLNWDGVTDTDWRAATRNKNSVTNSVNLNYTGGSENFQIFSSLGYFEQEGVSREAKYSRITGNLNANWTASDRLKVGFSINVSSAEQTGDADASSFRNPVFTGSLLSPTNSIYNADGTYNLDLAYLNPSFNPVAIQNTDVATANFYKVLANLNLDYEIIKNTLSFQSLAGVDMNISDEITFWNPDFGDGVNEGDVNGNGNGFKDNRFRQIWTWQNSLSFNKMFGDVHNITGTLGIDAVADRTNTTSASVQGYTSGRYDLYELENAANPIGASSSHTDATFFGAFVRGSYTYDRRYSVTGSFRRDGSSRFGFENRYGNFWAAGGTWNIAQESFLDSATFVNSLKLRVSYGITGNASVGNHSAKALVGFGTYLNQNAAVIINPGNSALTWETKKNTNLGLDFSLFESRVSGSIDVYKNESEDLLFSAPITPSSGFTSLTKNIGTTENRGVEVQLGLVPVITDNFRWSLNTTFSLNENEVTKITDEANEIAANGTKNYAVGHDPSEFYTRLWAGVNPADGTPLWYTDESRTEVTGIVGDAELSFTGKKALPKHLASISNEFQYKGFNFKFLLNYAGGHSVIDRWAFVYDNDGAFANLNHLASNLYDSWTPDNRDASKPQYLFNSDNNSSSANSTRYIYDADHIRLRSIELGYKLDAELLKNVNWISDAYIYVRGLNLYTWVFDDDLYFDPEVGSNEFGTSLEGAGVYDQSAPNLKQFLFGVNINF
ncbi:SusC/RagA family TonB-linked outer membrane protein [Winogradskyella pacifica]|uniref:SusC/RagA family TonB-linked outer membrane protein n=1 Tax=Winogradskyella pacifica TaxID=664642 RepID=UPI0015CBAF3C|nr:SusC/RagA family TonB-linked outer membrane protein [Winogradskyella pacifica]